MNWLLQEIIILCVLLSYWWMLQDHMKENRN